MIGQADATQEAAALAASLSVHLTQQTRSMSAP